jgi:hypothetical protein
MLQIGSKFPNAPLRNRVLPKVDNKLNSGLPVNFYTYTPMKILKILSFVLAILLFDCTLATEPSDPCYVNTYNVVWESPSSDATGQMPLGNVDIAAGVYATEDGDLYLLLSKNDAYTRHGDIFKTGRIRISLTPNPFVKGKAFRQELDLETGSVQIEADGGPRSGIGEWCIVW